MPTITVLNLSTGEELTYSGIDARQAVIAAHAKQVAKNGNTWEYEARYGHLVQHGKHTVSIGDYCAIVR